VIDANWKMVPQNIETMKTESIVQNIFTLVFGNSKPSRSADNTFQVIRNVTSINSSRDCDDVLDKLKIYFEDELTMKRFIKKWSSNAPNQLTKLLNHL